MPKTKPFDEHLPEYEKWFEDNHFVYLSELEALKKVVPKNKKGIEIGIGSGIFAQPLGITEGIEPSAVMRRKAEKRRLNVFAAVAEKLPYSDESVDFALMITTICFVDDIRKSFSEAFRILKNDGFLILGFVDKNSPIGKFYLENQDKSIFYRDAKFFTTEEVLELLRQTGFVVSEIYQTVFGKLNEVKEVHPVEKGYGKGSFVAIKAKKEKR